MADQIEPQSTIVMSHIADIKEKLATNTESTKNTNTLVVGVQETLKTFNLLFVNHDQFKSYADNVADHEARLRSLESKVWKAIGALTIAQVIILPVVLYLFFKKI